MELQGGINYWPLEIFPQAQAWDSWPIVPWDRSLLQGQGRAQDPADSTHIIDRGW